LQRNDGGARSTAAQRTLAAWKMRACAAGMAAGAQVFLLGTGVVQPLCLNAVWLSALAALPSCALTAALCRRALAGGRKAPCRALHGVLALFFALAAVCAAAALCALAEQSLLPQTPAVHSLLMTAAALGACALTDGTGAVRLSFALRFALPALLFALCAPALFREGLNGLFPVFGTGAAQAGIGAGVMAGAAFPVLMLLYPPPEIHGAAQTVPVPRASFFVLRVTAGAACGAALLLAAALGGTYESLRAQHTWGERMMITAGSRPSAGLAQTGIVLAQIPALALLGANMLLSGAQAVARACPSLGMKKAAVLVGAGVFAAALALLPAGLDAAPWVMPALLIPWAAALLLHRRMGGGDVHGA